MESRFMSPLFFECDGTLEVCGPTLFGPDDVLLEITQLTIKQGNVAMTPTLPVTAVAPAVTWETEIPGAKGTLNPGPAVGAAAGYLVKRGVGRVPVAWPGSLELVDGCATLQGVSPGLVSTWDSYIRYKRSNP
jgi:hypothetical protein